MSPLKTAGQAALKRTLILDEKAYVSTNSFCQVAGSCVNGFSRSRSNPAPPKGEEMRPTGHVENVDAYENKRHSQISDEQECFCDNLWRNKK